MAAKYGLGLDFLKKDEEEEAKPPSQELSQALLSALQCLSRQSSERPVSRPAAQGDTKVPRTEVPRHNLKTSRHLRVNIQEKEEKNSTISPSPMSPWGLERELSC